MTQNRLEPVNTGNSVFIGFLAGNSDDLSDNNNVAVGQATLLSNTSGQYNTAIGTGAMRDNSIGSYNSAFGLGSQQSIQDAEFNTSSGANSLYLNGSGSGNSAFGYSALYSTTGSNNTGLGSSAGDSLFSGSNNTFLGFAANTSVSNGLDNATAIGANTVVGQSNALILGNNADIGIGTSTPTAKLDVVGTVKIADGTEGIDKILTSDALGNATWQAPVVQTIADASITEAKLAFDTATQVELDLKAPLLSPTFAGDVVFATNGVNFSGGNASFNNGQTFINSAQVFNQAENIFLGPSVEFNNPVTNFNTSANFISGALNILNSPQVAGYVLTDVNGDGNATWQNTCNSRHKRKSGFNWCRFYR